MVIGWNNVVGWVLVLHIAGVVMWIGGLFFALAAANGAPEAAEAKAERGRLARKAMRAQAHPGAALVILSGALLLYLAPGAATAGWLHAKLLLVLLLIVADLGLTLRLRRMPEHVPSPSQLGMFHGIIGLLFALILILALVKPF